MDNYGYSKKKKRRKRNIAIHNFLTYLSWCIGKEPRPVSLNNSADSAHPPHSFANKNQPLRPPPPPKTHPGIIFDIKPPGNPRGKVDYPRRKINTVSLPRLKENCELP